MIKVVKAGLILYFFKVGQLHPNGWLSQKVIKIDPFFSMFLSIFAVFFLFCPFCFYIALL